MIKGRISWVFAASILFLPGCSHAQVQYSPVRFTAFTSERERAIVQYGLDHHCVIPDSAMLDRARDLVSEWFKKLPAEPDADLATRLRELRLQSFAVVSGGVTYFGLEELEPYTFGFGIVMVRADYPKGDSKLFVEIPHPLFDEGTPAMGGQALDTLAPAFYLQAGAHRYCNDRQMRLTHPFGSVTDPAHSSQTFFHVAHLALVPFANTIVQLHGFGRSHTELYSANPPVDIILSPGTVDAVSTPYQETLREVKSALNAQGLTVRTFPAETNELTAVENIQGIATRVLPGKQFLHLEARSESRSSMAARQRIIQALFNALAHPNSCATPLLLIPDAGKSAWVRPACEKYSPKPNS